MGAGAGGGAGGGGAGAGGIGIGGTGSTGTGGAVAVDTSNVSASSTAFVRPLSRGYYQNTRKASMFGSMPIRSLIDPQTSQVQVTRAQL